MALASAAELEWRLGGVVALSPVLPPRLVRLHATPDVDVLARVQAAVAGVRVLACHGARDRVAPRAFAGPVYDWLGGLGAAVHVETWDEAAHELTLDGLCRAREFLVEQIPARPIQRALGNPRGPASAGAQLSPSARGSGPWESAGAAEARGETEEAACKACEAGLGRFVAQWSDPAAKVWTAGLQRARI
jgi:hypothetical protein